MQPWAMFIAIGLKTYETRSWKTESRGPLLIHAAQTLSAEGCDVYEKVQMILGPHPDLPPYESLARGVILCEVWLESIVRTYEILRSGDLTFLERALGDYSPGRHAWQLTLVKKYTTPLRAKGRQGLWECQKKYNRTASFILSQ